MYVECFRVCEPGIVVVWLTQYPPKYLNSCNNVRFLFQESIASLRHLPVDNPNIRVDTKHTLR